MIDLRGSICCCGTSILVRTKDGVRVVKYTDFGFALEVTGDVLAPQTHGFAGTPGYMSPELQAGKPYSSKSDVWSLAVCFTQVSWRF